MLRFIAWKHALLLAASILAQAAFWMLLATRMSWR